MSVSLLRTGEGISDIYNRHVNTVYRIALTILNNIPEAEDAAQTVFMKLITSAKSFECDEHLKAWLIVTTQNICKDYLKSWWRKKRVSMETVEEQEDIPASLNGEVWSVISNLNERYKLPVYLHYYEGYKTEEIALMLGINHATIRTRLKTARAKLRLILEEGDYELE